MQNSFAIARTAVFVRPVTRVFPRSNCLGAVPSELFETQETVFQPHPATPHASEQPGTDFQADLNRLRLNSKGVDGLRRLAVLLQPKGLLPFFIRSEGDDVSHYFEVEELGP